MAMVLGADSALADFYNWCGNILAGKETEEKEAKRIVKAMIDTGQQETIKEEFGKIQKMVCND